MTCHRFFHRRMAMFCMVLSLLFSQLALASYVCVAEADVTSMVEMMSAGEPCTGMDEAQPVLCHQHSVGMSQSFESVKVAMPSLPAIVQMLVMPVVLSSQASELPRQAQPERHHPPSHPLFLATARLRV